MISNLPKTSPVWVKERMTQTRLTLRLFANGIDFLRKAVAELHPAMGCGCDPFDCKNHKSPEPDPAAAKYAIMHAYAGVLLLLKERLRRKDPELVKKPRKGNPDATVNYHELLARLNNEACYELPPAAATVLESVRALRNPFEHYEVELEKGDGERMVAEVIEFAYTFMADELGERLESHVPYWVWLHIQDLQSIALRLEHEAEMEHAAWWKGMLAKYGNLTDEELDSLADLAPYHPKHNPDAEEFHYCPQCLEWSVVRAEGGGGAVCTNKECRAAFSVSYCRRCSELLLDDEDFCDVCAADLFGDDY